MFSSDLVPFSGSHVSSVLFIAFTRPRLKDGADGAKSVETDQDAESIAQSPLADLIVLVPTSSRGRVSGTDETPKTQPIATGARSKLGQTGSE